MRSKKEAEERKKWIEFALNEASENVGLFPAWARTTEINNILEGEYRSRRKFINAIYGVKRLISEVEKSDEEVTVMVLEVEDVSFGNGFNPETDSFFGGAELLGDAKQVFNWCKDKELKPEVKYESQGRTGTIFEGMRQFKIVIVW